jgi:enoyl-CoA hydratase/carnithine racemase
MENIKTETNEGLLVVTMARGKANALNSAMIDEMSAAIADAGSNDGVRGVVLASDRARFFSSGFDVTEVFEYDRDTMTDFFGRFIDLYEGIMRLPKPVVAAVSGHAFAGGAVLALACDTRVMAEGEFGFALNEINLGMALPPGMIRMAASALGVTRARELVLEARILSPAESLEFGLAAHLVAPDQALERAVAQARKMADKPPLTFGAIKGSLNQITGLLPTGSDRQYLSQFIEHWFSPESMRYKQALIDSLRR